MSLVLDCSVALAWIYPDETTAAVDEVFARVDAEGAFVPALWRLEVGNGLTVAVRRRRITAAFRADALRALELSRVTVDGETDTHAWAATLQLADRFHLTLYDAAYLELAHRRSLPLASLDRNMRRASQALALPLLGL